MRPGFVFDLNRCTGCQACVVACWMDHRELQTLPWRRVHGFNPLHHPGLPGFHLSLACHHCERPACLAQCPARAYTKDARTGAVVLHPERCLGCRYCTWACPYDAPKFSLATRTIEKCTFCQERLAEGLEPACVARCPLEALALEPERRKGPAVPGFPSSRLEPGLRFVPLRSEAPPELTAPARHLGSFLRQVVDPPAARITLRGEWSLLVFTTVLALLAAWRAASLLGGPALQPWLFLALGIGALLLSAWHLGHPGRAWRAVLNLGSSRLSQEVLLVSAFLGTACLPGLGWLAAGLGFAALFAVDRIYRVALRTGPWNLHSAHALLNGLYLLGWLAPLWPLALLAGSLKLGLYLHRKGRPGPWSFLSLLRVGLGFAVPAFLPPSWAALAVGLGDFLDRCEYYAELEIASPQGELAAERSRRLGVSA
jgi:Fe-S-cluster-containing dehydrogenase component